MQNQDITFCDGNNCLLRSECIRYTEGQSIKNSRDEGQFYWMDCCDEETRDGFKTE